MARIRSIHPNTPIDPELASVPIEARLLFIYSWTAADDAGNLEGNPLGLRMALFPADDWATVARVTELLEILIAGRFYIPYEADGKRYLHIRNFAKYQKLDHPTAPKVPLAPGQEYTYHVRQGNTFVHRTAHEQHTNVSVPFSQEVDMDRKVELDRRGNSVPKERTALRAGKTDKPPLDAIPAVSEAVGGKRHQRPNVVFMKTPRFED